eukprot:TRINITY_DN29648_c0_g1_i1.p1 TRINITY_DN29648_c0_g1~~TRINITY_DN29648_c0_g1_i1.p1  ORF type:complete len:477 (+),score=130.27 TRINITY_DN29648_c0_g1_i1:83-1432(+)
MPEGVDRCEEEQTALLRQYVLSREGAADSAASLAPFVPCAKGRLPYIRRALRLTSEDVVWDLGCGDGRVLLDAALRCGCRCVGIEVEGDCLRDAAAGAQRAGVAERCQWVDCDLTGMPPGWAQSGDCGPAARRAGGPDGPLPPPTAVLCFLTGHGLSLIEPVLRREWEAASAPFRIATCVEALDDLVDHLDEGSLFDAGNRSGWEVCRADAGWGVFVVPPRGVPLAEWQRGRLPLSLTPAEADATAPVIVPALLTPEEVALVVATCEPLCASDGGGGEDDAPSNIFELDGVAEMEDAYHACSEHHVVHLHRGGSVPAGLEGVAAKLRSAMEAADAWGILEARPPGSVNVRCLEYHRYVSGGGVNDEEHRDAGSLLTASVLLATPGADFSGGDFITWERGERAAHQLRAPGDAVVFLSEKRHNVTRVDGLRRALISELWQGPRNTHNRHR